MLNTAAPSAASRFAGDSLFDAHLHVLLPERWGYDWLADLPQLATAAAGWPAYRRAASAAGVDAALFMEGFVNAGDERGEADWAEAFCASSPEVRGYVFGGRLERADFAASLDAIPAGHLRGVRRVLHVEDDAFSARGPFRANLAIVAERGLTFDLCVRQRQLPIALGLAREFPHLTFVLDHGGNPVLEPAAFADWAARMRELADCANVNCKLSGFMGGSPVAVSAPLLKPYVEFILQAFGWRRVLWGSDWPICTLGGSLAAWVGITRELLAAHSEENRAAVFRGNAARIYPLPR